METSTKYLLFAVAVIVGGLVYLHYKGSQVKDIPANTTTDGDRTTVDPSNLFVQFYGTGNGTWIPGTDINIALPDNTLTGGGGGGNGEYDIITSMQ